MNEQEQQNIYDGHRYRAMRESMNLSREALAEIMGATRQAIWLRETGKQQLKPEHWFAIQGLSIRTVLVRSDRIRERSVLDVKKLNHQRVSKSLVDVQGSVSEDPQGHPELF